MDEEVQYSEQAQYELGISEINGIFMLQSKTLFTAIMATH